MENNREQIVSDLKEFFSKRKDVVFAYLFGSIAYNNYNSKSDIDVAVFLNSDKEDLFDERLFLINELETKFKKDVDVIILNTVKSSLLKYVVIKEGIVVDEKNRDKRTDFEFKTLQKHFDYMPISKMYNEALLSKI
ncbi:MAG: nucleotidyltransferase domain-containing protein [Candidatus Pacebacteria bacterium]|nr:nucleotidyltransferase domain-containing protein [Candidatus Paceibacterota bacterium]